jgi:NAD kinase
MKFVCAGRHPDEASFKAELDRLALPDDLVGVLGGDGTMLRAVREHGPDHTYMGFNFGHLGFLMASGQPRQQRLPTGPTNGPSG